jgi:Xaa-Pro dipeptidase
VQPDNDEINGAPPAETGPPRLITVGTGDSTWVGSAASPLFRRRVQPERWVPNLERVFAVMAGRDLDGLLVLLRQNVVYFTSHASANPEGRHDTEPAAAVLLSRHEPNHPILLIETIDIAQNLTRPTWIEDVRPYLTLLLSPDVARDEAAFDRFVPLAVLQTDWGRRARGLVADSLATACHAALADLALDRAATRIGIDNMNLAPRLLPADVTAVDAYGTMKFIRQIKTPAEIALLRQAAALNEIAIANTVESWSRGMTWFEFNHVYDLNCVALGGWVQYGGGIVLSNHDVEPAYPSFHTQFETEDFLLDPGINIMLDCHGKLDHYRWDGGKTWVVDDERTGTAARIQRACEEASLAVLDALRPGMGVHELQHLGREVFRKLDIPDYDRALVFFHGMGLDHTDIEIQGNSATPNWHLEENMVIATHVSYPGDARSRYYIEDIGLVTPDGGESLYTWGIEPHRNL